MSAPGILVRLEQEEDRFRCSNAILCYHDEDSVGSWTAEQTLQ